MSKDINWLKEEVKIEVDNLRWKGELDAHRANTLLNRFYYLIECYHGSQNKASDQKNNSANTHKWQHERAQTVRAQLTGDNIREVFNESIICEDKEEPNKELDWFKEELDFLHDNYKRSRQNTIEERTSYQDWLDGGLMVFKIVDNLIDQVETMQRPELPVIPNYVAEFVEYYRAIGGTVHQVTGLDSVTVRHHFPKVYENNSRELQELIARAWLEGYTVDDE